MTEPAPDASWPFVGRAAVVAEGVAALRAGGLVLDGPPGIGKSAVADAVAATAGWTPDRTVRALGTTLDATALDALARGGPAPTWLRIDDLHLLAPDTARALVRAVADRRIHLLATLRTSPRPTGSATGPLDALWRELGVRRLTVDPLDEDEVGDLLHQALCSRIDGRASRELVALAEGNPGRLRDLVEASQRAGALVERDGVWSLDGPPRRSPALDEELLAPVHHLAPEALDALEVLAVAGRLPLPTFESALGPDPHADGAPVDAARIAEDLERAGVVEAAEHEGEVQLDLTTRLLRAALLDQLPRLARRRHTARLASAAGPSAPDADLALRQVTWRADSGSAITGDELLGAARAAIDAGDPGLGGRLAEQAARAGAGTEAHLLASWCADERGDVARAGALLDGHTPAGAEATVAVAIRRAEQHFWHHRDAAAARAVLDGAARADHGPWVAALDAQQAMFDGLDGDPLAAIDRALGLVDAPEPLVSSTAALAAAFSLVVLDRPGEALEVAEAAMARLAASPTPPLFIDPGVHLIAVAFALHGAGRLLEADDLTAAAYAHTLARPGRQAQGWAALIRAHVLAARGRPSLAAEMAAEAELVWADAGIQGPARWAATVAANAHAEEGDVEALRAALRRVATHDAAPFRLFATEADRAEAWAAWLDGDADAAERFTATATAAARAGRLALAAGVAHDLVRIGEPGRACTVLADLPVGSPVTVARRALAEAALAGDRAGLESVATTFEGFGAIGWAAEARALAGDGRRRGELHPTIGQATADGLATPPLARLVADTSVGSLTRREAEIARLAAAGASNRAIADQLVVSLRTVENHLYRVYAKLGIASRTELADRLTG